MAPAPAGAAPGAPHHHPGPLNFTRRYWRILVVAAYAVLVTVVEVNHEPWFDEAQVWLLGRDASPWELLAHRLHYEGTPGLWHLIIMPLAKAGLPFRTISVVGVGFAIAGVAVFVWRCPLPPYIVAAVPFTYYVLFQYGVVARSYSLLLLLLALLAAGWGTRWTHPLRHALLLGLLSQVSLHGMIVAGVALATDVPALRRAWPAMDPVLRRGHVRGLAGLAFLTLATIVELWPTSDNSGGGSWHIGLSDFPTAITTFLHSSPIPLLVVPALVVLGLWFHRRRVLPMVGLALLGLVLLFVLRYASPWHGGVVFLLIVFGLWISWPESSVAAPPAPRDRLRVAALTGTMLLIATQVVWGVSAVRYDLTSSYSGTAAAAQYIAAHLSGKRIDAVGKWSAGVLAYFPTNIFANFNAGQGPAYWPWSRSHNPLQGGWSAVLADHPDAIVVTVESRTTAALPCVPGYRQVAVFAGAIYFATAPYETETVALYEPGGALAFGGSRLTAGCGVA